MGKLIDLNVGCANCSIIQSDGMTFLIDCYGIDGHASYLPQDKKIKALFVTHQHYDHFDGMQFLYEKGYSIDCLVYSPYERRHGDNSVELDEWNKFCDFRDKFKSKGASLYSPFRQESFDKPYWIVAGLKFYMIGPIKSIAKSETRELHDACLVITIELKDRKTVFPGDSSDTSLNYIANNTKGICGDILHASHHGSINGADLDFIKKASPKYTVISTASGVHENIPHPTAIKRYKDNTTEEVYRTDNGTITFSF